jgi:hypothetical protein
MSSKDGSSLMKEKENMLFMLQVMQQQFEMMGMRFNEILTK